MCTPESAQGDRNAHNTGTQYLNTNTLKLNSWTQYPQ
jgi:hypothetical protein